MVGRGGATWLDMGVRRFFVSTSCTFWSADQNARQSTAAPRMPCRDAAFEEVPLTFQFVNPTTMGRRSP